MKTENITYFLYARKSSESEDRQMASINNQIEVVKELAKSKGIEIAEVFEESKSAKAPGRPVFNEMMTRIEQGEADGIICWKLNRLARNPVDGGRVSWLLQNRIIKHIQCNSSSYRPTDNVLMMAVELGMANQFVKDLSVDIKRGVHAKAQRGWYPAPQPPLGYKHNKSSKKTVLSEEIIPDPITFPAVKKLWKLMSTGDYTLRQIKAVGDQLGLKTHRRSFLSLSGYNRLFKHTFYHGTFHWKDDNGEYIKYKGKHKTMISEHEYNKVQESLLSNITSSTPSKCEFKYRGWLRCGECSSMITAERKKQARCTGCNHKFSIIQKQTCPKCRLELKDMIQPSILDKTYYRCTRSKVCSQKYIEESKLEGQYISLISKLYIPEAFQSFLLESLEDIEKEENKDSKELLCSLEKEKKRIEKRLESLVLMRADGEIEKDSFLKSRLKLENELKEFEKQIHQISYSTIHWKKELKSYLDIGKQGLKILKSNDKRKIKRFMKKISSNQTLFSNSLYITTSKPLLAIESCKVAFTTQKHTFEPKNPLVKQRDLDDFETGRLVWWTEVRQLRKVFMSHPQ